ncbi:MAG: amidohydrolase family protein [Cytophagaceae bacterium]|nr:amidohydrolase family protein [Gemmatimonadaceae bacterium]
MNMRVMTLGLALFLGGPGIGGAQASFVVRNVRVFDGQRVLEGRDVLVTNGTVARIDAAGSAVPDGIAIVNGTGRTLLPGLMDAHVHVSDSTVPDLHQAITLGVTTMFDMFSAGSRFDAMKAIERVDRSDVASVRSAGIGASAPGGHPSQMGGPPFPMVTDSSQSQDFVNARVTEGSDYVKIIYDDLASMGRSLPRLDRGALFGLVAAAHAAGKLAVVHAMSEAQASTAIDAGADGLVHLFNAATVSPEFARLVASHRAFVVPTLTVHHASCGESTGPAVAADTLLMPWVRPAMRSQVLRSFGARPGISCEGTREAVRQLAREGVPILAGTDAPSPGHAYGASLHYELQLLVRSGLTPVQALTAATLAPARAFRLNDRGAIAPGARADLLLVDGDPTVTIADTRRIVTVWKRGVVVDRARYP